VGRWYRIGCVVLEHLLCGVFHHRGQGNL
jgi:hypothetical protein